MAAWSFTREESHTFSICQTICYFALYCNSPGFSSWLLSTLCFSDYFTDKEPAWCAKKMKLAAEDLLTEKCSRTSGLYEQCQDLNSSRHFISIKLVQTKAQHLMGVSALYSWAASGRSTSSAGCWDRRHRKCTRWLHLTSYHSLGIKIWKGFREALGFDSYFSTSLHCTVPMHQSSIQMLIPAPPSVTSILQKAAAKITFLSPSRYRGFMDSFFPLQHSLFPALTTLVTSPHSIICLSKKNEKSPHKRIPTSSCTGHLWQSQWHWRYTPSHLESFSDCRYCLLNEVSYIFREFFFSGMIYTDQCFINLNKKPTMSI